MHEQGTNFSRYSVIPRALVFLFTGDSVLLLKGAPDKRIWPGLYNGIGGHIEAGESVLQGANRELLEETGIGGIHLTFCAQVMIDVEPQVGVCLFVFKAVVDKLDVLNSAEGSPEWIPLARVYEYPLVKDLHQLLPKVIQWEQGAPILLGRYFYSDSGELISEFSD